MKSDAPRVLIQLFSLSPADMNFIEDKPLIMAKFIPYKLSGYN